MSHDGSELALRRFGIHRKVPVIIVIIRMLYFPYIRASLQAVLVQELALRNPYQFLEHY